MIVESSVRVTESRGMADYGTVSTVSLFARNCNGLKGMITNPAGLMLVLMAKCRPPTSGTFGSDDHELQD